MNKKSVCIVSVSYTHLDVYKRQGSATPMAYTQMQVQNRAIGTNVWLAGNFLQLANINSLVHLYVVFQILCCPSFTYIQINGHILRF